MSCRKYKKELHLLVDGGLSSKKAQELTAHIKHCAECQQYYDQLLLMKQRLFVADQEVPSSFSTKWKETLLDHTQPSHPTPKKKRTFAILVPVAAAVICGIFVFTALPSMQANQPAIQSADNAETFAMEESGAFDMAPAAVPQATQLPQDSLPDPLTGGGKEETAMEQKIVSPILGIGQNISKQDIVAAAKAARVECLDKDGLITLNGPTERLQQVVDMLGLAQTVDGNEIIISYS